MYNFTRDLIYFIKRDGTSSNPYQSITERITILYDKAFLQEVPVQSFRVVAKVGTTILAEVSRMEDIRTTSQYYVNYKQGIVYFHSSRNNQTVTLEYRGQGVLLYPASRIYIDGEGGSVDAVKTLKQLIEDGDKAIGAIEDLDRYAQLVDEALEEVDIAIVNSTNLLNTINSKMQTIESSENTRISNENTRIANENDRVSKELQRVSAEDTRVARETVRRSNEDSRISAEQARVTAENTRVYNETLRANVETARTNSERDRKNAEEARVANENTRIASESQRVTAENERISKELQRADAETARASSEATRESSELARVNEENTRKSNEDTRIENEDIRIENENTRIASEDIRIVNENDREQNEAERLDNESARESNENIRISNELERVSNEDARKASELERESSEQIRIANEQARVTAENTRVESEDLRIANEASRQATFQNIVSQAESTNQIAEAKIGEMEDSIATSEGLIDDVEALINETTYLEDFHIDTSYKKNNIVSYNGSSYIAKQETVGNLPTNEVYWGLLAMRGVDGTGAVSSVNGLSPDENGNVVVTAEGMGAERVSRKGVADGYAGLDSNAKVPLSQIPDVLKQQVYVVADSTERLALTNLISGDKAYETSTGDSYIYDGNQWLVMADADWENVSLEWINIVNKPNSTVESIDLAVSNSHTHANIDILNKFSIENGKLKYDGMEIGSVESVNGMTGVVTITASSVGAYSKSETDELLNGKISTAEKGVANGVARLNADGKVIDASGNEVEGKVRSVNGMTGDVTGLETVEGSNTKMNDHKADLSFMHVEILDSEPTTFDKNTLLFIRKSVVDETPSTIDAGLFTYEDDGSPMDLGLFNYEDDGDSIDEGTF